MIVTFFTPTDENFRLAHPSFFDIALVATGIPRMITGNTLIMTVQNGRSRPLVESFPPDSESHHRETFQQILRIITLRERINATRILFYSHVANSANPIVNPNTTTRNSANPTVNILSIYYSVDLFNLAIPTNRLTSAKTTFDSCTPIVNLGDPTADILSFGLAIFSIIYIVDFFVLAILSFSLAIFSIIYSVDFFSWTLPG